METCRHCGWEVKQDFGMWADTDNGVVCYWENGEEFAHEVLSEKFDMAESFV